MDRVGFIGLGLMGKPMALNLLKKGFTLTVHSRSQAPVDARCRRQARRRAASPAEVAAASDVIITMVPDSPDVRLVLEGPRGVFETVRAGSVIVDMSTIAPAVARELAGKAAQPRRGDARRAGERRRDRRHQRVAVHHGRRRRRGARARAARC